MSEKKWENYGDVNPIEHGGMFVLYDEEIEGRCYYVIEVNSEIDGEEKWAIIDGYVDLDDDWIEWDSINETMDSPSDADDKRLVTDVMHYYGTHLSNGKMEIIDNREMVIEYLTNRDISEELLNL
jgi:hypothetical protein